MLLTSEKIQTMDINMLFSIVNLKLRDEFSSLRSLCQYFGVEQVELETRLQDAGFQYDEDLNQLR